MPRILGWDAAGEVIAVGSDCTLFEKGDTVYYADSISRPGTNCEFHLVDEGIVGRKPKSLRERALAVLCRLQYDSAYHRNRWKIRSVIIKKHFRQL